MEDSVGRSFGQENALIVGQSQEKFRRDVACNVSLSRATNLNPGSGAASERPLWENKLVTGVQFVTDSKGRKVAVLIDLKSTEPGSRIFGTVSFLSPAAEKWEFRWRK